MHPADNRCYQYYRYIVRIVMEKCNRSEQKRHRRNKSKQLNKNNFSEKYIELTKQRNFHITPKKSVGIKSQPKEILSPLDRNSKIIKPPSPHHKTHKININMEIKNLNIYGNQSKKLKKIHKKTISYIPHHKEIIPKNTNKKLHQKAKSQQNIKVNPFEWNNLLAKGDIKGVVSKYAYCNRGGVALEKKNKINQDTFIIIQNFMTRGRYVFGVCDGHGVNGHYVAEFIKEILPQNLQYYFLKNKSIHKGSKGTVENTIKQAFTKTSKNLTESGIDVMFSGTTACVVYINQNQLYCANLGDSRAVLYSKKDKWAYQQLSYDHKADNEREAFRITMNGGRVFPYHDELGQQLGPYRVWIKDQNIPGLAMTRSFGDYVASTVGVISQPEVIYHQLSKDDKFVVVGSDGLWQFLTNEQVMEIVWPTFIRNDPEEAVRLLEMAAVQSWQKQDENIDDITIQVIFFKYY